jgi:uncharacterized BrkB/YihY/UPF0761 family membrane protein
MRLKLVLLTSLLGAVISAGVSIAMVSLWLHRSLPAAIRTEMTSRFGGVIYIPAIIMAVFTAIFVYRHTARRRKLQAMLTGALTIVLWFAAVGVTYVVVR